MPADSPLQPLLRGSVTPPSTGRTGFWSLYLFPQPLDGPLASVLDLLIRHARPLLVVTDVGYLLDGVAERIGPTGPTDRRGLSELARAQDVASTMQLGHGALAIATDDLLPLLRGVIQWNLVCWDAPATATPASLARQVDTWAANRQALRTAPLRLLPDARLWVSSHDNDSFTLATRHPAVARAIYARALANRAAPLLNPLPDDPTTPRPVIPLPPAAVIEALWAAQPRFEFWAAAPAAPVTKARLFFGAPASEPGGTEPFEPQGHLEYHAPTATWTHRTYRRR
jgi:hypothetical protein